jgi:hypothetical protein
LQRAQRHISPGARTIPAPIVLPIATATPNPTPNVLMSRPRPPNRTPADCAERSASDACADGVALSELESVAKEFPSL